VKWRWVDVEPDDVAHLFHEEWIGRELEGVDQMWFQSERPPDPADGRLVSVAWAIERVD